MTNQTLGASTWNSWLPKGAFTQNTPHSAACANGNMVVSILDGNGNSEYAKFDGWGNQQSSWATDSELTALTSPVQLTANGNGVFALANFGGDGLWRHIYNCN
jgi:hypothetical protein